MLYPLSYGRSQCGSEKREAESDDAQTTATGDLPFPLLAFRFSLSFWYARRDLNARPLAPQASALSPELRALSMRQRKARSEKRKEKAHKQPTRDT